MRSGASRKFFSQRLNGIKVLEFSKKIEIFTKMLKKHWFLRNNGFVEVFSSSEIALLVMIAVSHESWYHMLIAITHLHGNLSHMLSSSMQRRLYKPSARWPWLTVYRALQVIVSVSQGRGQCHAVSALSQSPVLLKTYVQVHFMYE